MILKYVLWGEMSLCLLLTYLPKPSYSYQLHASSLYIKTYTCNMCIVLSFLYTHTCKRKIKRTGKMLLKTDESRWKIHGCLLYCALTFCRFEFFKRKSWGKIYLTSFHQFVSLKSKEYQMLAKNKAMMVEKSTAQAGLLKKPWSLTQR